MRDPRFLLTLPGVPRRTLSRLAGAAARLPVPRALRSGLWGFLARRIGVDPLGVPGQWQDYRCFLDLFARALPAGARPRPEATADAWLSPADGALVEHAPLRPDGTWLIKGTPYANEELLPGAGLRELAGCQVLQIYLAPRDYHRCHSPCAMRVEEAWSQDGDLQPVDPRLVRRSMRVLARNRRVLLRGTTARGEPAALLFVGALNVGGMRFTFDSTLGARPFVSGHRRYDPPVELAAGAELGRFELGSTVLLFVPPGLRSLVELGGRCRALEPLLAEEAGGGDSAKEH